MTPTEDWTSWVPFPDPRSGGFLNAPFGAGVYELRNITTGEMVLVGIGAHCANRMSSLLPKPFGVGTRNNTGKRDYLLKTLAAVEYRCLACESKEAAKIVERRMLKSNRYLFHT